MNTVLFCPGCRKHSIRLGDAEECIICSNTPRRISFKKRCSADNCLNPVHPDYEYVISLDIAVLEEALAVEEEDVIEATRRIVNTITIDHNGVLCQTCLENKVTEVISELGIELLNGVAGERRQCEFEEEWV